MSTPLATDAHWVVSRLIHVFREEAPGQLPEPRVPRPAEQYAVHDGARVEFPDVYRELRELTG